MRRALITASPKEQVRVDRSQAGPLLGGAEKGVGTTSTAYDHIMKSWFLVFRLSPRKKGPRYEGTPRLTSYSSPLFHGEGLGTRCLAYQVFMVRLVRSQTQQWFLGPSLPSRGPGDEAKVLSSMGSLVY